MKFCRGCGFPVQYGRFLEWTADGTILGKESSRTRLVFVEVHEVNALFNAVSRWLGFSIDPIIYRAEKEVGRRFIKTLMPGVVARMPRGKIARPEWGVKMMGHFVFNYMSGLGMGKADVLEYKSGESARIRLVETHCAPLVVGDGAGVFEYLERVGVDAHWERARPEEYVVSLEKVSDEPPEVARLAYDQPEYVPGEVKYDHCPKCKVPREVTKNLYLNLDRGVLRHNLTGSREVALPVQSFHAVFREFHREFGDEIISLMEKVEQDYTRDSSGYTITKREATDVLGMLSDFPWRGLGNPVWAGRTDQGLEVVVENPFHPGMVAGRVAGLYEALTGYSVRAGWAEDGEGRVKVTITEAADVAQ